MSWFKRKPEITEQSKPEVEKRADAPLTPPVDPVFLNMLLGTTTIDKTTALNIPTVNSCIEYIANTVSMLPIKLYREQNGEVTEIKDDYRLRLLNDDTGDTLTAVQFWKAMLRDYFLDKGAYAYINKHLNRIESIHYVESESVSINKNIDPIFKSYDILVNGKTYYPFEFFKLLRKTRDGCRSVPITEESNMILSVAYSTLAFEEVLVKKGGNKKGFLTSDKHLSEEAITQIRTAWESLYSNNTKSVVVLNEGMDFKESSNTSVEMQLDERKKTNAKELCKLFNIPPSIIEGTASEKDYIYGFTMACMPVIADIQCSLNRDWLLESEKDSYYFAVDTKEMTKGDIKTRYEAYKIGIEANFLQPDEVRYLEDIKPLGLDFIKMGLDSVLYYPKTKEIFTPNTGAAQKMSELQQAAAGNDPEAKR